MLFLRIVLFFSLLPPFYQIDLITCVSTNKNCTTSVKVWNVERGIKCECPVSLSNVKRAPASTWEFLCSTGRSISFKRKITNENGFFVHLQTENMHSQFFVWTEEEDFTIEGLASGSSYVIEFLEIRFHEFRLLSAERIAAATFAENDVPDTIQEITVSQWDGAGKFLKARLQWLPGLRSTCHFDFVWHNELLMHRKEVRNIESLYTILLEDLLYDQNYTLIVTSVNDDYELESTPFTYILETPLCSQVNSIDTSQKCTPDKLEGFTINEVLLGNKINGSDSYDVLLKWNAPSITPDVVSIEIKIYNSTSIRTIKKQVEGNATSAVFSQLCLTKNYRVRAWAISSAGSGPVLELNRQLQDEAPYFTGLQGTEPVTIIAGCALLLSIVAVIMFSACLKYVASRDSAHSAKDISKKMNTVSDLGRTSELFTDIFEVPPSAISICGTLGEGAFGVVQKAILTHNGICKQVAVKSLKEKHSDEDAEQLIQEIKMLHGIGKHEHVVAMLACVTKCPVQKMMLIVEFCALGDLLNYLQMIKLLLITKRNNSALYENERRGSDVESQAVANKLYNILNNGHQGLSYGSSEKAKKYLISFARQVADGMEFLSGNRIIHRDLAARNVLVTAELKLKISDFGLSRDIYQSNCYVKTSDGKVPIKWMAIESLLHQKYTTQSDVWSFGILLWEIMTYGCTPYIGESPSQLITFLCNGGRLPRPENTSPALYAIMLSCWNFKPCDRPRFSNLKDSLDDILLNDDYLD